MIGSLLGAMISSGSAQCSGCEEENRNGGTPVTPEFLKKAFKSYSKTYKFKVGDLVTWKPGMSNKRWPKDGEPAIVVEVLDEPIIDMKDGPSSPYYTEPLDIKLGIGRDGDFMLFMFCSKRLMPYKEEKEETPKTTQRKRKLKIGDE